MPKLPRFAAAQGDAGAVTELAKMLVNAESPVIMADRGVPGPNGVMKNLITLAELLHARSPISARA